MKVDRRGFIKLAVGAAAGFHLTPLPWKLMDDIAIWTQNWPWVPRLPRYPESAYAGTICDLCDGGCGIKVRLVNKSQAVKVEGDPSAPINRGKVCLMGAAGPQYQYSVSRFHGPVRRIGTRGSGAFVRISWEEALKEVGTRLAELRREGQAHSVVLISGRRHNLVAELSERFLRAYGSPNLVKMPSGEDGRRLADLAQFGRKDCTGYDLEHSKFILSFGCGLIEGWGAPVRSIQAYSGWRAAGSAKFVQVDSRSSLTASKADEWVAVAPGTEAALALGLAHVIIKEGLHNRAFIDQHTFGFEAFEALTAQYYSPSKVSAVTGVPESTIIGLAREFARIRPAVAIAGKGKGDLPTPVYEIMAVHALNALVGNINQEGGLIVRKDLPLSPWPEPALDATAQAGTAAPRLDLAGGDRYPLSESLLNNLVESVQQGRLYPVKALIIDRANPAFFGPDPGAFRAALAKIPFIVSLSSYADDTSIHADIVLPEAANFEGPVDVVNPPTLPYPLFGLSEPALARPNFETKPAGDIYLALAKAVGDGVKEALPFKSYKEAVKAASAGLYRSGRGRIAQPDGEAPDRVFGGRVQPQLFGSQNDFFKALAAGRFWYDPDFTFGDFSEAFQTPSGKFEFVSQTLKKALAGYILAGGQKSLSQLCVTRSGDEVFLPHYESTTPTDLGGEYPLLLVPVELFKLVNDSVGGAPYLTKLLEDDLLKGKDLFVQINPRTAVDLGLAEGERAWLKTKKGKLAVRVHLFEGARPRVVYAPIGLGHLGYDLYWRGKGVNPMEIVETTTDPLSGQALWWGTRANLTKV